MVYIAMLLCLSYLSKQTIRWSKLNAKMIQRMLGKHNLHNQLDCGKVTEIERGGFHKTKSTRCEFIFTKSFTFAFFLHLSSPALYKLLFQKKRVFVTLLVPKLSFADMWKMSHKFI
jgi:hypothetical protein